MTRLVEALGSRIVGSIERVSPDRFSVAIDTDASHATALNTGAPEAFPRVNGYLLVPHSAGATVGIVSSVRIERTSYPKRKGLKDFDLVDLPFPQRMVEVTPIGTLQRRYVEGGDAKLVMERGVDVFPSVGDGVRIPGSDELAAIVGSDDSAFVPIGRSPLADGVEIRVDPDRLFGRHLAVLGNTGSGKSCSVVGLIRWSVEAAAKREGRWRGRVIVLDPNGEYGNAFDGLPANVRVFRVAPDNGTNHLRVPAWLWNVDEWVAFTRAAPGVQRPILVDALRRARGIGLRLSNDRRQLATLVFWLYSFVKDARRTGSFRKSGNDGCEAVAASLRGCVRDLQTECESSPGDDGYRGELVELTNLVDETERKRRSSRKQGAEDPDAFWHTTFSEMDMGPIEEKAREILTRVWPNWTTWVDENAPVPMDVRNLAYLIDLASRNTTIKEATGHTASLALRVETLMKQERLHSVVMPSENPTLAEWLCEYLGPLGPIDTGSIVVLDLSLVPADIIHTVVSVTSRVVFEALQRHRRLLGNTLPTCLVVEEAHTFAHMQMTSDSAGNASRYCCETMERIAREGRKFGLGMVLSSQRPSELSPTVLSQCNTFLIHRLVNDRDQEQVRKLVPDGLGDVLRGLPSLPTRRAILLGWATAAPVIVEMRSLQPNHRPRSSDPDFWRAWTEDPQRTVDWEAVAKDWVGHVGGDGDGTVDCEEERPECEEEHPDSDESPW